MDISGILVALRARMLFSLQKGQEYHLIINIKHGVYKIDKALQVAVGVKTIFSCAFDGESLNAVQNEPKCMKPPHANRNLQGIL